MPKLSPRDIDRIMSDTYIALGIITRDEHRSIMARDRRHSPPVVTDHPKSPTPPTRKPKV